MTALDVDAIDWAKADGLVPAVVQDASTLQVLMLGYMNREALERTISTERVTFFSRSRDRLWQKGESSGHFLTLVDVQVDCDRDALLVTANPAGPTCHRETTSCFGEVDAPGIGWLGRLETIVEARKLSPPSDSYTSRLMADGVERMAKKVGEEAVEVALSAALEDGRLVEESADLLYHLLVLLHAEGKELADVASVLRERHPPKPS